MNNLNKKIKKAENELNKLRDQLKALHKKDALVTGDVVASQEMLAKEGDP